MPLRLRAAWRRYFMACDAGAAITVAIAFILWQELAHGDSTVDAILKGDRAALYGTLASVFGALLGFVIATIAIVLALTQSDRFAVLRAKNQYSILWRIYTSTVRWLGAATVASVGGLLFDRDSASSAPARDVVMVIALLAVVRLARAIWGLEKLIEIATTSPGGVGSTKQ